MAFKDLTHSDRVVSAHVDIIRHKDFAILGGVTQIGQVFIDETVPTAGTDGCDVYYNPKFIDDMSRPQLRYLVLHENMHKALHHCTDYAQAKAKYPSLYAQAIDHVVNLTLEEMDTAQFLERPTSVPPLCDPKYKGMSVLEVMSKMLKDPPKGQPMDEHIDGKPQAAAEAGPAIKEQIEEALAQGAIVQQQLRGAGAGSASLSGFKESNTDWRGPLRRFIQEICEGDDQSRFSPPNKRLLPLGIIMPSHFSEATGELIVACDTSGSMDGIYPVVFGEIARIAQTANPTAVRIIWWDTQVSGEQVFLPKDYARISGLMKPQGGGGTTVSCVAKHIAAKRYKPKAVILLTDGYIESEYTSPPGPLLWGIVDNPRFTPLRGKKINISSVGG